MMSTLKNCRARIKISTRSKRVAASIRDAIQPDLTRLPKTETEGRTEISRRVADIIFTMESRDIASLRASVNSYIRLVEASYKCIAL